MRFNGKFTSNEQNNISKILNNNQYSVFRKLRDIKDLRILEDSSFYNKEHIDIIKEIIHRLEIEEEEENELENEDYAKETFIPVYNLDYLFNDEFDKLLSFYLIEKPFKNKYFNKRNNNNIKHNKNGFRKKFQILRKSSIDVVYRRSEKFNRIIYPQIKI